MELFWRSRALQYSIPRILLGEERISKEKTLTSAEIEDVANGVINKLVKRFGAELRSK